MQDFKKRSTFTFDFECFSPEHSKERKRIETTPKMKKRKTVLSRPKCLVYNNVYKRWILLFLLLFSFGAANSQITIFSEDFEEAGTEVYTSNQDPVPVLTNNWIYEKTNQGRLRMAAGSGFYYSGSNAATLDVTTDNNFSENYLIATIDLGTETTFSNLKLSFYYMDHGDESHAQDRVFVRAGESETWVELYNLNANSAGAGIWNEVTDLDVSAALAAQTENDTLQIRFGQYDNYTADDPSFDDGFTFDLIQLTAVSVPTNVFYSYQSGNWSDVSTWTKDPSGTTQTATSIPGDDDFIVILDGRTVTLDANIASENMDITIRQNGIIDMSTYQFTNGLKVLQGSGILQLASINFPVVTNNFFVASGGGTTEYYNASDFTLSAGQTEYNNLQINAPGVTATQLSDLQLNGDLIVKAGTFRINDNTSTAKLNLTIQGNVEVENSASISVGEGVTNSTTVPNGITGGTPPFIDYYEEFHRVVVYGDFTNNGTVRFTNLDYPIFNAFPSTTAGSTTGAASVYFRGATNNRLECNNTTDFYNLILDKGVDQSYSLTVYSSAYENLRLFGANSSGGDQNNATAENPNIKKALWIRTGTLALDGMTIIPSLSEGGGAGTPNSDFYLPVNAALTLDGPEVVVLSSADTYDEVNAAYNVSGGSGLVNGVDDGGNASSFSILGKLEINDGYFSTRESGGFIAWDYASGKLIINGGIVDAKQFRSAGSSGGLAAFRQTGGTFILRGRFQRTPTQYTSVSDLKDFSTSTLNTTRSTNGLNGGLGTFNLNEPENAYFTSGGRIQIYDVCGTSTGAEAAFEVFADPSNISVSGGTVEIIPTTGTGNDPSDFHIETRAEIGNFIINRASGSASVTLHNYPLEVVNDIHLDAGVFDANNLDVSIGGDFNIAGGTTYTTGDNWTIFNGIGTQLFSIDLASPLNLNKFLVDKAAGSTFQFSGSQSTINIADSVVIYEATMNDNGATINIAQSIYHSGVHTGTGKIVLNSDADQLIDGDGTGIFQNIELNKPTDGTAEVSIANNMTVNGILSFTGSAAGYKSLNIGEYNLQINEEGNISGADANRFIITNGEVGNRGVTKVFSSTSNSFTFPVGAPSTNHATAEYTPASISFSTDPSVYGSITVVPVGKEHPNVITTNRSLSYYWKVSSDGFSGIAPNSIDHTYTYSINDVVTAADVTEDEYVPARYDISSYSWAKGTSSSVDQGNNSFGDSWLTNTSYLDGDYTAGDDNPIDPFGSVTIFYSTESGRWDQILWSNVGHGGPTLPPGTIPGTNNPVVISEGDSVFLQTNTGSDNAYPVTVASLQIEDGSVLDIGNNPASSFGIVSSHPNGNGKFRLTSRNVASSGKRVYQFPSGDFTDFNVNGGSTEFYSTSNNYAVYYLPANVDNYGNLILFPTGTDNIVFPNTDVTVYGDITIIGSYSGSWFCPSWYDASLYNTIEKTIKVKGDVKITSGTLFFTSDNGVPQHFEIDGDLIVYSGAYIDVNYDPAPNYFGTVIVDNTIELGGSLINNNEVILLHNNRRCNLTFSGDSDAEFTNNSGTPTTVLNKLTVDKGSSQSTNLTIDIDGTLNTPDDDWLTLLNGTLQYIRTGDFRITEQSSFTIPATAGLYLDTPSDIFIANDNVNNNDLYLSGKITLVDGNLSVGRTDWPNNNNDIEYSAGGSAELDIQGGSFTVNGQIRRNVNTDAGVLKYGQSGGSLTINGRNTNTDNAKLEILNPGSAFDMSGGTITLVRGGGGNTYGDLYLRPESSTVSGGEVVFSQGTITSAENYILDATIPLNDLTITGTNNRNAQVELLISPLELRGDLTLSNDYSILDANESFDIDITIQGDFFNSGVYNYHQNQTTFNGGTQNITGSSEVAFYDLIVDPVTSLTLNNNATIYNDLDLNGGTLICGANGVYVSGDFTNNATYTETALGVILDGSSQQSIYGTGTFGRLELDNPAGVRTENDITLQEDLVLTEGIFDINEHLLTLSESSDILGAPFSDSKMISSDGVLSNVGIRKVFSVYSGAGQSFTFPIGTANKYTPAVLTYTDNTTVGSIRVNNINAHHPGVLDNSNVLDYYWEIESSAISGFNGDFGLYYKDEDVQGGPESDYIAARLLTNGDSWSKAAPGASTDNVDEGANIISFSYVNTDNLTGEYTAGIDAAIPDNVPEFTSLANGDWSDHTNWVQTGGDTYNLTSGGPNGFIVIIDHEIEADADYISAYRTIINDKLKLNQPFFGHNLGKVDGDGTLYLEGGTIPAGRYDDFFDCSGNATLEYSGSGDYTIIGDLFSSIPNIHFTGSGTRILPNKDLTVCHQFMIDGPTVDNSLSNRKLTIEGTMERYNTGAFNAGSGSGAIVSFAGTGAQTIGGALGDFTGSNAFNHFEIDNSDGLTINAGGAIEVAGNLYLSNGNITTGATNTLTITNTSTNCVFPAGGSSSSYVDGPLTKQVNQGDSFTFPIGEGENIGNKLTLSATQTGTQLWTVKYYNPNTTAADMTTPLSYVNADDYWTVSAPSGNQAIVNIEWDALSDLTPLMTENGLADMRVAQYNTTNSEWEELASTSIGDSYDGTVSTTSRIAVPASGSYDVTTACINAVKPRAKLNPSGPVCGNSGIPVQFTATGAIPFDYTLNYTIDGIPQTAVTITSGDIPYTLPTPTPGEYQLTSFYYDNGAELGVVDANTVHAYEEPTVADAGPDQNLCGATSATLAGNSPVLGNGVWSIVSGTGGTVVNPTSPTSIFNGTNGTTYVLRWTITNEIGRASCRERVCHRV